MEKHPHTTLTLVDAAELIDHPYNPRDHTLSLAPHAPLVIPRDNWVFRARRRIDDVIECATHNSLVIRPDLESLGGHAVGLRRDVNFDLCRFDLSWISWLSGWRRCVVWKGRASPKQVFYAVIYGRAD